MHTCQIILLMFKNDKKTSVRNLMMYYNDKNGIILTN